MNKFGFYAMVFILYLLILIPEAIGAQFAKIGKGYHAEMEAGK